MNKTLRFRRWVNGNCIAAAAALWCFSVLKPDIGLTPAAAAALIPLPPRIRLETVKKEKRIDLKNCNYSIYSVQILKSFMEVKKNLKCSIISVYFKSDISGIYYFAGVLLDSKRMVSGCVSVF